MKRKYQTPEIHILHIASSETILSGSDKVTVDSVDAIEYDGEASDLWADVKSSLSWPDWPDDWEE